MDALTNILLQTGLLKLTIKRVDNWAKSRQTDNLEYAVEHGIYFVRVKAIVELGKLRSNGSAPVLIKAIDDNIKNVSLAAMKALEQIGHTEEVEEKIIAKRKFWTDKEEREKQEHEESPQRSTRKWERRSKQTLENVKQMLKKPMIGGKWF